LVDEARAQRDAAVADWEELQQRQQHLTVEQTALRDHLVAVQQKLALQVGEHQAVAEAAAQVAAARARLLEAEVAVEHAALVLERMIVRAPLSGRILERLAEPGSSLMGLDSRGGHQSSAVATLYDPATLQVRADVRLEDYAQVVPDQEVKIETASCPTPLRGQVLLSTSTANIQKNTVEVKVAILDPPDVLRPEMLVTATFLAPNTTTTSPPETVAARRVLIPQTLVFSNQGQTQVWVLTPDQRAEARAIQASQTPNQDLIEVTAGLQLTDKLIVDGRQGLIPGTRVVAHPAHNFPRP
jgi:multidrug efflux pump subunit AcrA (membrane-fusion protein)